MKKIPALIVVLVLLTLPVCSLAFTGADAPAVASADPVTVTVIPVAESVDLTGAAVITPLGAHSYVVNERYSLLVTITYPDGAEDLSAAVTAVGATIDPITLTGGQNVVRGVLTALSGAVTVTVTDATVLDSIPAAGLVVREHTVTTLPDGYLIDDALAIEIDAQHRGVDMHMMHAGERLTVRTVDGKLAFISPNISILPRDAAYEDMLDTYTDITADMGLDVARKGSYVTDDYFLAMQPDRGMSVTYALNGVAAPATILPPQTGDADTRWGFAFLGFALIASVALCTYLCRCKRDDK